MTNILHTATIGIEYHFVTVMLALTSLLDEQVFLIESHRKKMLKAKIADLEADLEVVIFFYKLLLAIQ